MISSTAAQRPIKVLLVDDHQMFIDGARSFLESEPSIKVIGEASNGIETLKFLENEQPDVIVLDIMMPELDGLETLKFVHKHYPDIKVLMLTMHDNKEFIIKAIRYGATGYILKNKTKDELYNAIINISQGRTHFGLEVMQHAVSVSNADEAEEETLTEREIEVLKSIAEGNSSKESAMNLGISETTINTHRRNIMAKLELPSATHLVRYAIKHGYVEL